MWSPQNQLIHISTGLNQFLDLLGLAPPNGNQQAVNPVSSWSFSEAPFSELSQRAFYSWITPAPARLDDGPGPVSSR